VELATREKKRRGAEAQRIRRHEFKIVLLVKKFEAPGRCQKRLKEKTTEDTDSTLGFQRLRNFLVRSSNREAVAACSPRRKPNVVKIKKLL
jgi:hypothetical protein